MQILIINDAKEVALTKDRNLIKKKGNISKLSSLSNYFLQKDDSLVHISEKYH